MTILPVRTMNIADLKPRDRIAWWQDWGQCGRAASLLDNTLTASAYYWSLLEHMQNGGTIEPLVVGPWTYGINDQVYCFDGHHRFALAKKLGWLTVPVIDAGVEYTQQPAIVPVDVR